MRTVLSIFLVTNYDKWCVSCRVVTIPGLIDYFRLTYDPGSSSWLFTVFHGHESVPLARDDSWLKALCCAFQTSWKSCLFFFSRIFGRLFFSWPNVKERWVFFHGNNNRSTQVIETNGIPVSATVTETQNSMGMRCAHTGCKVQKSDAAWKG